MRATLSAVAFLVVTGVASAALSSLAGQPAVPLSAKEAIKSRVPAYLRYVPTRLPARYHFQKWEWIPTDAQRKMMQISFNLKHRPGFGWLKYNVYGTSRSQSRTKAGARFVFLVGSSRSCTTARFATATPMLAAVRARRVGRPSVSRLTASPPG
jgi:hypothetical protein